MKTGFKLVFVTLPIAAIGAGALAFFISNSPPPERIELAERANAVRVITAERQVVTPVINGFGLVTPSHTFDAIAQVGGTVEYVHPKLQNGQILPAGAVLLRLSPIDFNLAIAQANADIRAANARLAELGVSEANQREALKIEREVLTVKAAEFARAETLFASGTMPQSSFDSVRAAHLAQRLKVQTASGVLALLPTQRTVQTEQIAVYQTALATAQRNLERSTLTLPFAARVTAHNLEVGQFLTVGHTAVSLDGIDSAEVDVQISMSALRRLMRSGQFQQLVLPADPTQIGAALRDRGLTAQVSLRLGGELITWPAVVDRIRDGIDQRTGTIGVVVHVQAAYGQSGDGSRPPLTKGMFVDVALSAEPISGIVIPRSAIHDGKIYIVDADNRLQIITAIPQLIQGGIALFTDGIEEGSRVVLSTPIPVVDGLLLDPHADTELMSQLSKQDRP